MKQCQACGMEAEKNTPTCCMCGEASWSEPEAQPSESEPETQPKRGRRK